MPQPQRELQEGTHLLGVFLGFRVSESQANSATWMLEVSATAAASIFVSAMGISSYIIPKKDPDPNVKP